MCSLSRALFQLLHYICTGGGGGDVDLHRRPLLLPAVQHQAEASRRHSNYYILILANYEDFSTAAVLLLLKTERAPGTERRTA